MHYLVKRIEPFSHCFDDTNTGEATEAKGEFQVSLLSVVQHLAADINKSVSHCHGQSVFADPHKTVVVI